MVLGLYRDPAALSRSHPEQASWAILSVPLLPWARVYEMDARVVRWPADEQQMGHDSRHENAVGKVEPPSSKLRGPPQLAPLCECRPMRSGSGGAAHGAQSSQNLPWSRGCWSPPPLFSLHPVMLRVAAPNTKLESQAPPIFWPSSAAVGGPNNPHCGHLHGRSRMGGRRPRILGRMGIGG